MGKFALAFSLTAVVLMTGCASPRADYLEPETENAFLKNVGRVSTVLSPISFGARILVAEISRDLHENGIGVDRVSTPAPAPAPDGKVLMKDAQGEPYYVVQYVNPGAPADAVAEKAEEEESNAPRMVASKQSYFILDGNNELKVAR